MGAIDKADKYSFPRVYSLHSQKGGVGKTSITLAIAGLAAHMHGKKTFVIDADLTGVSLCDISGLTKKELNKRQYFNDLLLAPPNKFADEIDVLRKKPRQKTSENFYSEFCWLAQIDSNITILPSSPKLKDVSRIIPLITQEDHLYLFRYRFEDILTFILNSDYEVVIIDFSPGLFGISKSIFSLVMDLSISKYLKKPKIKTRLERLCQPMRNNNSIFKSIMCTTMDKPDYSALFGSLSDIVKEKRKKEKINEKLYEAIKKDIWLAFNKVYGNPYDDIPPIFHGIEKQQSASGYNIDNDLMQLFSSQMEDIGAKGGPLVENHRIEEILLATEHFSKQFSNMGYKLPSKKEKFTRYYDWLYFVGRCSGLVEDAGLIR